MIYMNKIYSQVYLQDFLINNAFKFKEWGKPWA